MRGRCDEVRGRDVLKCEGDRLGRWYKDIKANHLNIYSRTLLKGFNFMLKIIKT